MPGKTATLPDDLECRFEFNGSFSATHRLKAHKWLCRNPHGHNYRVIAEFEGEVDRKTGMLGWVDFGLLKARIRKILEEYDHTTILEKWDPLLPTLRKSRFRVIEIIGPPTTENIVREIFADIQDILKGKFKQLRLKSVMLRETDTIGVKLQYGS